MSGNAAVAPVEAVFRTKGLPEVQAAMRAVGAESGASAEKWGMAGRRMSGALLEIGRSGEIGARGIKELLAGGAEMALGFSAGGAIVGAVAILGAAIYEHITGRMKEARAEIRKFDEEIQASLKNKDLIGAGARAQALYSGDKFAVQREGESDDAFANRQRGVLGIQAEIDRQRKIYLQGIGAHGEQSESSIRANQAILDLLPTLKEYEEKARKAGAAVTTLANATGELAKTGAGLALAEIIRKEPAIQPFSGSSLQIGNGLPGRFIGDILQGNQDRRATYDSLGLGGTSLRLRKQPDLLHTLDPVQKGMQDTAKIIGEGFANTLTDSIQAGMEAAFAKGGNAGKMFAAVGDSALSGLGSIAIQIGKKSLVTFAFIDKIVAAIHGFDTPVGIAASIGLIAFGSALVAGGHRVGSNSSSSGGGAVGYGTSGVYGASGQIIDRGYIDPTRSVNTAASMTPRQSVVFAPTIIGTRDPKAMRELEELFRNGRQRGGIS